MVAKAYHAAEPERIAAGTDRARNADRQFVPFGPNDDELLVVRQALETAGRLAEAAVLRTTERPISPPDRLPVWRH